MNNQNTTRIQIHLLQNHAPANLNRDDLGAPKTCYLGGVLRSRISSQCLKRSIRLSPYFKDLCGGVRTRRLAKLITDQVDGNNATKKKVAAILKKCGLEAKENDETNMVVYTTKEAIREMATALRNGLEEPDIIARFKELLSTNTAVPDMALCGRMLETGEIKDTNVEAALQAAHAISTHEARPEVDYYVTADDIPGTDAGAGYVDEAIFVSACYYKYFSIDWAQLLHNLKGYPGNRIHLAAHTVGAFIKAAALVTPSGKQNSYAAHNPPDGILVEISPTPINYANAFAKPVDIGQRDLIGQSIAQLAQYIHEMDAGFKVVDPSKRFWFSPGMRNRLETSQRAGDTAGDRQTIRVQAVEVDQLENLIHQVIKAIDPILDWQEVQRTILNNHEA